MLYADFLDELEKYADKKFAAFHGGLIEDDSVKVIGVRTPVLRKLTKKYGAEYKRILTFPDEYYEVKFIKLAALASLPYDEFVSNLPLGVSLISNWALCDSAFSAKCIEGRKAEFFPHIRKLITGGEYSQRYALVCLLQHYIEDWYLEDIFSLINACDTSKYYVAMAAAWLIAEITVKRYDAGKSFLMENTLDKFTHNKAIQKASESFRLSNDRKNYLKVLKR